MWAFLTSKLGGYVVCGAAITAFLSWTHYELYQTGRRYERQLVFTAAIKAYKDRADETAAVEALDPIHLCIELGGLPDQCAAELRRLGEDIGGAANGDLSGRK